MAEEVKKAQAAPQEEMDNTTEKIDNLVEESENFVKDNGKNIAIGVVALVAVIIGVMCYINLYSGPKETEAAESMFKAEQAFERDSFALALNGNGADAGFLSIIDEYGSTKAGNAAKMYAGLCYKEMGKYEDAIKYLKSYSSSDGIIENSVYGALGDCYWNNGDKDNAISSYKKAIDAKDKLVSPIYMKRLAVLYLANKDNENAKKYLEDLKTSYPESIEAKDADKLLSVANAE